MPHPLVTQLRFARSEFQRGLRDVLEEDGIQRIQPMNSISWIVGHLANQENYYWVRFAQQKEIAPQLNHLVGSGRPASTPPLSEMWTVWDEVTLAADIYLDSITSEILTTYFEYDGRTLRESAGTLLQRNLYHYWYHLGEASAVRQVLGHPDLPDFVGNMSDATYKPETNEGD